MNYVLLIPRVLWKCWISLNFGLGLLLLYPFFLVLLSTPRLYPSAFFLMRVLAHWIAYASFLFPSVKRQAKLSELQPCIYIANHNSYLDILMAYVLLPHYFLFMGKREIEDAPLLKVFFRDMNILVNRKSNVDAHRAFLRASQELDKGRSIFIFPEGGIIHRGPQLHRFKNGAFRLAIEKQLPVVPITFRNNFDRLQTGSFLMAKAGPGIVKVIIHKPIFTKGMSENDLVPLREECFRIISEGLKTKA